MKVWINVDQAVWERSTFEVEVPDGLTGDELKDAIRDAVDNYDGYGEPGHQQEILDDPVYGIDVERRATLPGGQVMEV